MEVTRTNFQEVLTELDDVLKDATFLAIDGEFTGLNSGSDTNAYDTPSQYYDKLRAGSMNFLLVQFGLAVFTYNTETNKYSQRSYNFYVFPQSFNRSTPDCRFMCQASCITFLVNQGFNFNKLFKHGIPYLTKDEEDKLNMKVEEKQKIREGPALIPISDNDKPLVEEICSRINDFIKLDDEEITIDKCNFFIRRLIYQEVRFRWPNKIGLRSDCSNQAIIVYKMGTKEEEEQREAERREKGKAELQEAVGLSALLKKIADAGKLIVGHNMLLDLCHIINQFFNPLPESYSKFKSLVHCLFPRLLDTKIVCQSAQFKESVPSGLTQLLETLHSAPFSIPETEDVSDRSYTLSNGKPHEAGYDAFITGICFIALSNRLGSLQKPEVTKVLADSELLNPFLNKLLITKLKDYPYINLTGKDPNPNRDHVFHITFPKEWKYSDLSQLFTPYGGVFVAWLNDSSAYVALNRRDQVGAVVKNLVKPHNKQYSLQKYMEYQSNLENEHPTKKKERKRKISDCESLDKDNNSAAATVDDTNAAAPTNPEEDGWEVASGNEHSKYTNHRPGDRVLRGLMLRAPGPGREGPVGPSLQRHRATVLGELEVVGLERQTRPGPGSTRTRKGSSACSLAGERKPSRKRKSYVGAQKPKSPTLQGSKRTMLAKAAVLARYRTWPNLLRLVALLVILYLISCPGSAAGMMTRC